MQRDVASPATSLEHVRSVPIDEALLEPPSQESADEARDVTAGEMAEAVAEAMARTPANAVVEEPAAPETDGVDRTAVVPDISVTEHFAALLGTAPVDGRFSECRIDAAHDLESSDAETLDQNEPVAVEAATAVDPIEEFLPSLRVDRFVWPEESLRMNRQAADQLGLLSNILSRQQAEGRKVVGFGSHAAGQGCTTILLSVARRLRSDDTKVIVVDADFGNPCLSERLGIACRIGWNDVVGGGEPLEEVVIVSAHDGLALVPLRQAASGQGEDSDGPPDLGTVTRGLREHYDLVLVDLGVLNPGTLFGDGDRRPIKEALDGVVVVRDVRSMTESGLDVASQLLREAGLLELGVTENFV